MKYLLAFGLLFLIACSQEPQKRFEKTSLILVGEDKERGVACYADASRTGFACARIK